MSTQTSGNNPRSVMIADPDPRSRNLLAQACGARGWLVRTASSFEEAVTCPANDVPDYLIIDHLLRDKSPLALLQALRRVKPALEAVLVSRAPSIPEAVFAIRVGFLDYRGHPLAGTDLEEILASKAAAERLSEAAAKRDEDSLEHVERNHIQAVLTKVGGNVSEASRRLGIHRRSLQRKMRKMWSA